MQGVGRSQRGWFRVAGPAVVNGAHNAHFVPGFAEQPFQQIGAGGLAIGAGDAQDLQRQRIGVPAGLSQPPKGLARVRMGHHSAAPGYGSGRIGPADHSSRARRHGCGNKTRAVLARAGHGHEDVSGPDLTRIRAHFHAAASALFQQGRKIPFHTRFSPL